MLEIYNEKIQDLLIPINKRPSGGLRIREHKRFGIYVENQTKHAVDCYDDITDKMEEGPIIFYLLKNFLKIKNYNFFKEI